MFFLRNRSFNTSALSHDDILVHTQAIQSNQSHRTKNIMMIDYDYYHINISPAGTSWNYHHNIEIKIEMANFIMQSLSNPTLFKSLVTQVLCAQHLTGIMM